MKRRLLSGLALWAIIVWPCILWGELGAVATVTAFSLLTLHEFYSLLHRVGRHPLRYSGLVLGAPVPLLVYYGYDVGIGFGDILFASVIAVAMVALLHANITRTVDYLGSTLLGLILIPFAFSLFAQLMHLGGMSLGLWAVAVTKCADAGGLFVGRTLGRHLMTPILSPKKTWEGAVGGVIIGALSGWALLALAAKFANSPVLAAIGWEWVLGAGTVVAIFSILSDLLQSALKRQAGAKDSGGMVPGIGGFFDLTDSLMLALPVAYWLMLLAPLP